VLAAGKENREIGSKENRVASFRGQLSKITKLRSLLLRITDTKA
jgi:hypothetical protein